METVKEFFTLKRIIMILGILIIILFAVSNLKPVSINFLVANVNIPLFYGIVGVGIIGFISGYLFTKKK